MMAATGATSGYNWKKVATTGEIIKICSPLLALKVAKGDRNSAPHREGHSKAFPNEDEFRESIFLSPLNVARTTENALTIEKGFSISNKSRSEVVCRKTLLLEVFYAVLGTQILSRWCQRSHENVYESEVDLGESKSYNQDVADIFMEQNSDCGLFLQKSMSE
nr:unnamed protein product [Callosobruchus analis]